MPVRGQLRLQVAERIVGESTHVAAVHIHEVEIRDAAGVAADGQASPVGGPRWSGDTLEFERVPLDDLSRPKIHQVENVAALILRGEREEAAVRGKCAL